MCYVVKIDMTREALEKRFGAKIDAPAAFTPSTRVSAFSLPAHPVVTGSEPGKILLYVWGLVPYWVKDEKLAGDLRMKTFNARSESLTEKPSFRHVANRKRCLVLTNGFYEWHTEGKHKIPYFIGLKSETGFALAGLHDTWTNPLTGEILNTFTVITTRANPMMEEIHNLKKRMPVILSPENEARWLDVQVDPLKEGLFEPYDQDKMFAEAI
jgi:putative SOS response-associated peptidase YedK